MMRASWMLALALGASGCQTTTCAATDFDCAMAHLSIRVADDDRPWTRIDKNRMPSMPSVPGDGSDGYQLELVPLSVPNWGDPVELMQSGLVGVGGGNGSGATPAPSLSSPSVKLSLSSPDDEQTVMLSFVDPNGETPAICARLVDPKGLSGPYYTCPEGGPKRDLQSFGIVQIRIRFNAFVDHSMIDFGTASKIEPSPIVPTPIVPSPLQTLPPLPPTVGVPVRWPFVPPAPPTSGNNGGGGGDTVGAFSQCAERPFSCSNGSTTPRCTSLKFCASGMAGVADCQGAWFGFNGAQSTEFDCKCSDQCIGAANAVLDYCCPPPPPK